MPGKTNTEKINEVEKLGETFTERVDTIRQEVDEVDEEHAAFAERLNDLRREFDKEIALIGKEIDDFKKWKEEQKKEREEWSRRIWAFGPSLLAALIGGVVVFVAGHIFQKK